MSKELSMEEVRQNFLEHIHLNINYWGETPGSLQDKMEGLAFSILVMLDGGTDLPGFIVMPNPHKTDKEYCKSIGENWYPTDCDISGSLHELFDGVKKSMQSSGK